MGKGNVPYRKLSQSVCHAMLHLIWTISTHGTGFANRPVGCNSENAVIMCGMFIINGVNGPEPRSSGGNTSSSPQISVLIPRPVFNGVERVCQRQGSNQNFHPHVLVRKPLCNVRTHPSMI